MTSHFTRFFCKIEPSTFSFISVGWRHLSGQSSQDSSLFLGWSLRLRYQRNRTQSAQLYKSSHLLSDRAHSADSLPPRIYLARGKKREKKRENEKGVHPVDDHDGAYRVSIKSRCQLNSSLLEWSTWDSRSGQSITNPNNLIPSCVIGRKCM